LEGAVLLIAHGLPTGCPGVGIIRNITSEQLAGIGLAVQVQAHHGLTDQMGHPLDDRGLGSCRLAFQGDRKPMADAQGNGSRVS